VGGWFRHAAGGFPRQFWFLWTGTLINRLGGFVVIFLAIYLTGTRHFSQSQAGLVIGLYGVGGAIGTTIGGVLADRWGRRPTMLLAQFSASALMLIAYARSPSTTGPSTSDSRSPRWPPASPRARTICCFS
jgi:MFS family permease